MLSPKGYRGLHELMFRFASDHHGLIVTGDFDSPSIDSDIPRCGSGGRETQLMHLCWTTPFHQAMHFSTRLRESYRPLWLGMGFFQKPEEVREIERLPPLGNSDFCVIRLLQTTGSGSTSKYTQRRSSSSTCTGVVALRR